MPEAGGYLDQPARMMAEMEQAYRVWEQFSEYRRMRKQGGEAWAKWQNENYDVIDLVREMVKE